MLVPLTRETLESLMPLAATGPQYAHEWGKFADLLKRLLFSVGGVVAALVVFGFLESGDAAFGYVKFFLGVFAGLYWLWGPVFWASKKNYEARKIRYAGFWRGQVLEVYISDEVRSQEETVNRQGDLVVTDNYERCLNLEVGDNSGFATKLQVPLKKMYQGIRPGDSAEMVVLSHRSDLGRIARTTDIFIPECNVWVSDYPYLQREAFEEVSKRMSDRRSGQENQFDSRGDQRDELRGFEPAQSPRQFGVEDWEEDQQFEAGPRRLGDRPQEGRSQRNEQGNSRRGQRGNRSSRSGQSRSGRIPRTDWR
jgi:hypothetical protein